MEAQLWKPQTTMSPFHPFGRSNHPEESLLGFDLGNMIQSPRYLDPVVDQLRPSFSEHQF